MSSIHEKFINASNYVRQAFSASESYLLNQKDAGLAVLSVLKRTIPQRFRSREQQVDISTNTKDVQHEDVQFHDGSMDGPSNDQAAADSRGCVPCFCVRICNKENCFRNFLLPQLMCKIFAVVGVFVLAVILFRNYYDTYVSQFLKSFEEMDDEIAVAAFVILFAIASLPFVWGYVILNLAAGYRYGIFQGMIIVMISVTFGLAITHRISKRFCAGCIFKLLRRLANSEFVDGILKVLDSPSGLKVIALMRLTPIPFGLQNGIFAISDIQTRHYVAASNIGLFPTQVLNCYIGSTFHSAEEMISQGSSFGGYLIFFIQLSIGIALMSFVVRQARKELNAALSASANTSENKKLISDEEITKVRLTQPSSDIVLQIE